MTKCTTDNNNTLVKTIEDLSPRLRRSKKRVLQYRQNSLFQEDTKNFYKSLKDTTETETAPSQKETSWKGIYECQITHNENTDWIKKAEDRERLQMEWTDISVEEVTSVLSRTKNWKATGIDKIPNFWWKELHVTHKYLAEAYKDERNTEMVDKR